MRALPLFPDLFLKFGVQSKNEPLQLSFLYIEFQSNITYSGNKWQNSRIFFIQPSLYVFISQKEISDFGLFTRLFNPQVQTQESSRTPGEKLWQAKASAAVQHAAHH